MATEQDSAPKTLQEILVALQSIAVAVHRGSDLLVSSTDDRRPTQEQSTTILDYLVLRELTGRQADQIRRTVGATRYSGQLIVFDGAIPETATRVAVFTRRGPAPDEVVEITDLGIRAKKADSARARGGTKVLGIELEHVSDDQAIVRLELRSDDGLAVALGPRLASVTVAPVA